ncbi:hypothetical protein [Leuconostoc pseudomesenteroides]|uniref:hypothetical protein n=1 Tax=Leuconostoc pseudomesenteroides TaxID=33968 RepID=UPI001123BF32|nr:hypothetical protein [Leuconostoc pseudomesenteroides]TOZ06280.1 hypothetical protein DIS14_05405 [Leuconostoc pseudomesenteroides]
MKYKKELFIVANTFSTMAIIQLGISVFSNIKTSEITYLMYGATLGMWIATILIIIITAIYNKEQK